MKDGELRVYHSYKNERGKPCLKPMAAVATDRPDGVIVQFAVKPDDINNFAINARLVFTWFDVRPQTNIEINYPTFDWVFEGNNYKIFREQYRSEFSQSYVKQGNVAYPIVSSELNGASLPAN